MPTIYTDRFYETWLALLTLYLTAYRGQAEQSLHNCIHLYLLCLRRQATVSAFVPFSSANSLVAAPWSRWLPENSLPLSEACLAHCCLLQSLRPFVCIKCRLPALYFDSVSLCRRDLPKEGALPLPRGRIWPLVPNRGQNWHCLSPEIIRPKCFSDLPVGADYFSLHFPSSIITRDQFLW